MFLYSKTVVAADLSQFQAGRIIDDDIFTDSQSMTTAQIQDFLVQKNSVCLKDFRSLSLHDDNGDGIVQDSTTEKYGPGTMSAAELISTAARIYRISPKVILVTLQKEQGLITRTDCPAWRYNTALGYGCPDTALCDQAAYGFTRQIDYGTYHFRGFFDDSLPSVPYGTGNYTIAYNPTSSCGNSVVNIQNRATASLYSYTPYQPNSAALAAGYGDAPPCGSYGNRNFFSYFSDWFGNTTGPGYSFVTATNPPTTLLPNQVVNVSVTIKNLSGSTWYSDDSVPSGKHPTRLMMGSYTDTPFADTSNPAWLGTRNQVKMQQATVANGDNATFSFTFRGPLWATSSYTTHFRPVTDGVQAFRDIGMGWLNNTPQPNIGYDIVNTVGPPATIQPGQSAQTSLTVKNTGNTYWNNDTSGKGFVTRLATIYPNYRASDFYDPTDTNWVANNQIMMQQTQVAPGELATFSFNWKAPIAQRTYSEPFSLVIDGYSFLPGVYTINTNVANYDYDVQSVDLPSTLLPGDSKTMSIKLKNTGSATWYSDGSSGTERPMRLAVEGYGNFAYASPKDPSWLGSGNQIVMQEQSVPPGSVGTFQAVIAAPYQALQTRVSFRPVRDGVEWLRSKSELNNLPTSTPSPSYNYTTVGGTVNPPATLSPGQQVSATLVIRNDSNAVWRNEDSVALRFGATRIVMASPNYRSSQFSNTDASWLGTKNQIKMVTAIVRPGENGVFTFTWTAPSVAGHYVEYFNIVVDGYAILPFKGMGFATTVQ
jgi:hypothetical protein